VIVAVVWRAGVLSGIGAATMGSIEVTTLHPQGPGDVASSLLEDSSRGCTEKATSCRPFLRTWHLSPAQGGRDFGGQSKK
jgi:hypothetical protein